MSIVECAHACTFDLTPTLQWVATCACGKEWTGSDYATVRARWRTHLHTQRTEPTDA